MAFETKPNEKFELVPKPFNFFFLRFPDKPYVKLEERKTFYFDQEECYKTTDVFRVLTTPGFWSTLTPYLNAIEAVKEMDELENITVHICTSPFRAGGEDGFQRCIVEKREWVKKYFGEEWLEKLYIESHKERVTPAYYMFLYGSGKYQ